MPFEKEVRYVVRYWDCGEPLSDKYTFRTRDLEEARKEKGNYQAIDADYAATIFKVTTEVVE